MGVLAFIVILGALVLIHEAGHFFVARRSGVAVEEFGLGFPPRLAAVRRGATEYSLNVIPFGGFVRLVGENGTDAERPDSFVNAKLWKQILILCAGVIMNFLLAVVIMAVVLGIGIQTDPSSIHASQFAKVGAATTQIAVSADGAASRAGLHDGDTLQAIDGRVFTNTDGLVQYVKEHTYPVLRVTFVRAGQSQTVSITPTGSGDGRKYGLGISTSAKLQYRWYATPWFGLRATLDIVVQSVKGFGALVMGLLKGQVSQDVTGPIGIAVITNEISKVGYLSLLQFAAILSVSLAVLNILPLPALDGGRIFLRLIGAIRRRPVSRQLEAAIHMVGFYLLIAFLIYISVRDVQRFNIVSRLADWLKSV